MKLKVLSAAIARHTSNDDGLRALYLPDLLGEVAAGIVRSANGSRHQEPPYAILIDDRLDEDVSDPLCPTVGMGRALEYRRDDRLAVVSGPQTVQQSFSSSFLTVVEADYPGRASARTATLDALASAALDVIVEPLAVTPALLDRAVAVDRLRNALAALSNAYERLAQGMSPWNVYWFRHVGAGFEALRACLLADTSGAAVNELLAKLTYACFGLPVPADGLEYNSTRRVDDALLRYWSSADRISLTLDRLKMHPSRPAEERGTTHPLAAISFDDFGQSLASADNLLLAWGTPREPTLAWADAFSSLTEAQFFSPEHAMQTSIDDIRDADGHSIVAANDVATCVVILHWDPTEKVMRSEPLRIVVPSLDVPDEVSLTASTARLKVSGGATWEGSLAIEEHSIVSYGSIVVPRSGVAKMVAKPLVVSTDVQAGDPLASVVNASSSSGIYPVVAGTVGMWTFESKGATYKSGEYRGYAEVDAAIADGGQEVTIDNQTQTHVRIIAWGDTPVGPSPAEPVRESQSHVAVARLDLTTTAEDEISVGSLTVRWTSDSPAEDYLSPLVAAARGGAISDRDPDPRTQRSLRGRLEDWLAASLDDEEFLAAHGHAAMLENSEALPENLQAVAGGSLLVPAVDADSLDANIKFEVSGDLRASAEAVRFRAAISRLDLSTRMSRAVGSGSDASSKWPSRTSWAPLHGSKELDEYLDSYRALVDLAANGTSSDLYWATFPFSVSVYALSGAKARAVLLSPIHPLRLAWLAGAEMALRESESADLLAGVVEGWNLPLVGPQANSANGRMLAVPIDAGADQVFLGWSMLVDASVAGREAVATPATVGALAAPGSSVTGLNSDAVVSALATFQRMNPQVATLSVDLASSTPGARLEEVDQAVLSAISEGRLRGGVRVHDSMNRLGEAPLEELERSRLVDGSGTPVRWSRYKHDPLNAPASNIRFLQDAGIKIEVSPSGPPGHGLLDQIPLRRFETPAAMTNSIAHSFPAVEIDETSPAFVRALAAAERRTEGTKISVELFNAALVNASADWTVTGESLVGASALADMLAADGGGQMLWEWRPPFLDERDTPQLDARPFVSVVRLPEAFKKQVRANVEKASGSSGELGPLVNSVMNTLGTRGIGLSSLTAQGGTHAAGAIGFYLSLRLIELARVENAELLVLPIDACDGFLRALANESASANKLRRADLLIIALRPDEVAFVPVEIKCFGLEAANPAPALPSTRAHLADPLQQLESTSELLVQLISVYRELQASEGISAALWRHGLATMLEAGMRLRPAPSAGGEVLKSTIAGVLEGTAKLRLGRALVCHFGHEASAPDGTGHLTLVDLDPPDSDMAPKAGALVCRTQSAFAYAVSEHPESDPLDADWQNLLTWALDGGDGDANLPIHPPTYSDESPEPDSGAPLEEPTNATDEHHDELDSADSNELEPEDATTVPTPVAPNVEEVPSDAGPPTAAGIKGDGVRFELGKLIDGTTGASVEYWPSNTELTQMNIGVIGDLGTGKTQFLKSLVHQLRATSTATQPTPVSVLIFDYKRDYQDEKFLASVGGTLLRPFHIPLALFSIDGEYTPLKAVQSAKSFVDVVSKIYNIGAVQRTTLTSVIKDAIATGGGDAPTMSEILAAYQVTTNGAIDSVTSVLTDFVDYEVFSEDASDLKSMAELLSDSVLVVGLNDFASDEQIKTAVVTLFLNKYYEHMLLQHGQFQGNDPQLRHLHSFVLVDEATNVMQHEFAVLEQLLLQGREFGFGVILASQYMSHFKVGQTRYGESLLTKVVHRVPPITANDLRAFGFAGATQEMADKVPELKKHQALVRTLGFNGRFMRGTPYFELVLDPAGEV